MNANDAGMLHPPVAIEPALAGAEHARSGCGDLTIVSYNIHSCKGLDGRCDPERVAAVLARLNPDVVALQELDVAHARSGSVDQPQLIADALGMQVVFFATLGCEPGERYGIGVLTRFPMEVLQAARLPQLERCEPRAAIWVRIDCHGTPLNVINTHLGLTRVERERQLDALLGPHWAGSESFRPHGVICGDFNAGPGSGLIRRMGRVMPDARSRARNRRGGRSWMGLRTLDYVFVSDGIDVHVHGIDASLQTRIASDHLPVAVRIRMTDPRQ